MRPALRRAVLAAALSLGLLTPAAARADLPWVPCSPTGFECAKLPVPLDRTGATPGTLGLAVTRVATQSPAAGPRTAVVAIAGGPGQAAVPLAADFARVLAPAVADHDLLVLDQRGTGGSNALTCPSLDRLDLTLVEATANCAQELGSARAFFRTPDSVEDIEALRVAAGYDKLILYGVSYGTKVATAYAAAHPDRVDALVLDSVVTPEGPDALRRSSFHALPRVLTDLCSGNDCRGITRAPYADLRHLAARLRRGPIHGPVYSSTGRRYTAQLSESGLFDIFLAGDLNPTLRAELPGSIRAALTHDDAPILRLSARSGGLANVARLQSLAQADSDADFFATTCEENTTFPWTRGASITTRAHEAEAAARALPASVTAPFGRTVALRGLASLCLGWPVASPPPAPPGPLPAVRTLVLDGDADLRTPLEDAASVAARIAGAALVGVPHVGHSVLGADDSGCADAAVKAFFGGQPVAPCTATDNGFSPTPRPPRRLDSVKPIIVGGKPGRTFAAFDMTLTDARRQIIGEALALGATPDGAGGLRGGRIRVTRTGYSLKDYSYIPGVTLSGTYNPVTGAGRLRVGGRSAARGTLTLRADGTVRGTLGGRRIAARRRPRAAVARHLDGGLPSLREAVRRGRLIRGAA